MKADTTLLKYAREVVKEANEKLKRKFGGISHIYEIGIKYIKRSIEKSGTLYIFEAVIERKLTGSIIARILSLLTKEERYGTSLGRRWHFIVLLLAETREYPTPFGSWYFYSHQDDFSKSLSEMASVFAEKLYDDEIYVGNFAHMLSWLAIAMSQAEDGIGEPFTEWVHRFAEKLANLLPPYFRDFYSQVLDKVSLEVEWEVDRGLTAINSSLLNVFVFPPSTSIIFKFRFKEGNRREIIVYLPLHVKVKVPAEGEEAGEKGIFTYEVQLNHIYISLPGWMSDTPQDSLAFDVWSHLLGAFPLYRAAINAMPVRFRSFEDNALQNLAFDLACLILIPLRKLWIEEGVEDEKTVESPTDSFLRYMKRACLKLGTALSVLVKAWIARRGKVPPDKVFARISPAGLKKEEIRRGTAYYYETTYNLHLIVDIKGSGLAADRVGEIFTTIAGTHAADGRFGSETLSRLQFLIHFTSQIAREGKIPPKTLHIDFSIQSDAETVTKSLHFRRTLNADFNESDKSQKEVLLSVWRMLNDAVDLIWGGGAR